MPDELAKLELHAKLDKLEGKLDKLEGKLDAINANLDGLARAIGKDVANIQAKLDERGGGFRIPHESAGGTA